MPIQPARRSPLLFMLAAAVLIVIAIGAGVVVRGDDTGDDVDEAADDVAGDASDAAPLEGDCVNLHAGHGIAMWSSAMADEMTAAGCSFPYEPFDPPLAGGAEDPTITAPFEPHMYDELWQVFSGLELGVCQIATLGEGSVDGFAFGFRYAIGQPGCPDQDGDSAVVVREYVTRGWRDAHAHRSASSDVLVLGRWVLEIEGIPERTNELVAAMEAIGAVAIRND